MVKIINDALFKDFCIFRRGCDAGKRNKNYNMCYVTQL